MPFLYYYKPLLFVFSTIVILITILKNAFNLRDRNLAYYQNKAKNKAINMFFNMCTMVLFAFLMFDSFIPYNVFLEMLKTESFPQNIQGTCESVAFIVLVTIITAHLVNFINNLFLLFCCGIIIAYRFILKKEKLSVEMYGVVTFLFKDNGEPDVGVKAKIIDESGNIVAQMISNAWGFINYCLPKGKYKLLFEKSESGIEREEDIIYNGFAGMKMRIKDIYKDIFKSSRR